MDKLYNKLQHSAESIKTIEFKIDSNKQNMMTDLTELIWVAGNLVFVEKKL